MKKNCYLYINYKQRKQYTREKMLEKIKEKGPIFYIGKRKIHEIEKSVYQIIKLLN